jgi:Tfp pilus assembly protein PilE
MKNNKLKTMGNNNKAIGFTTFELMTVILVIAILAGVSYPLMRSYKPSLVARGGARLLGAALEKARARAARQNRPVRVVVNCDAANGLKSCFIDVQTAVFKDFEVTGWARNPGERRYLDRGLNVVKKPANGSHDGKKTFPGIFWSIFMPAGQVLSDPKPMSVFLYHGSQKGKAASGWRVTVDPDSGRVETRREPLASP